MDHNRLKHLAGLKQDSPLTEQNEAIDKVGNKTVRQLWNTVAKMIAEADEGGLVEDIGHKNYGGVHYHEFMIDGHVFHVMLGEEV